MSASLPNLVLFPVKFDILFVTVQHFGWKVFSTRHCNLFVSFCKRAFDEQFVFLYSAFRCARSRFRFSFSALSSLFWGGLVQQYRFWIVIFEQAKYRRAEEGEKMLSSLRVSPSSRVAIFTRPLVSRSHFYSWGKWGTTYSLPTGDEGLCDGTKELLHR